MGGLLVNGNMGQNSCGPIFGGLILTHTQKCCFPNIHLLKNTVCFSLLVLKGTYHYWTTCWTSVLDLVRDGPVGGADGRAGLAPNAHAKAVPGSRLGSGQRKPKRRFPKSWLLLTPLHNLLGG